MSQRSSSAGMVSSSAQGVVSGTLPLHLPTSIRAPFTDSTIALPPASSSATPPDAW